MPTCCMLQIYSINNINVVARLVPFLCFRATVTKMKRVAYSFPSSMPMLGLFTHHERTRLDLISLSH